MRALAEQSVSTHGQLASLAAQSQRFEHATSKRVGDLEREWVRGARRRCCVPALIAVWVSRLRLQSAWVLSQSSAALTSIDRYGSTGFALADDRLAFGPAAHLPQSLRALHELSTAGTSRGGANGSGEVAAARGIPQTTTVPVHESAAEAGAAVWSFASSDDGAAAVPEAQPRAAQLARPGEWTKAQELGRRADAPEPQRLQAAPQRYEPQRAVPDPSLYGGSLSLKSFLRR